MSIRSDWRSSGQGPGETTYETFSGPRGSGKTTWLVEKAVWALGENPGPVIVIGAFVYAAECLRELEHNGLVGVAWMTPSTAAGSGLAGRIASAILIDDADMIDEALLSSIYLNAGPVPIYQTFNVA